MRGKRIFFFDPDFDAGRAAERALHATGSAVVVSRSLDEAIAEVVGRTRDLFFLNCDPPVLADGRLMNAIAQNAAEPGRIVLMTSSATEDYLPLLEKSPHIGNLVARNTGPLEPDEIIITAEKLLRREIFGMDKYLMWGVEPYTVTLRESVRKAEYVKEVVSYALALGCTQRTIELIDSIADELVSNAIYNAPRNPDGSSKYGKRSRREPVVLAEHEVAELSFACDGNYLAISTVDPFGALAHDTVVSYLSRCLIKGPNQISDASGGAGLGLFRVFQSLSKFIVNIAPGKKTEVLTLVDLRLSMREFRQATKSFHVFVERG